MEQAALRKSEESAFNSRFGQWDTELSSTALKAEGIRQAQAYAKSDSSALALPQITLSDRIASGSADPDAKSVVVIDKTHHRTHVLQMQNGNLKEVLNVADATGKKAGATPEGRFNIIGKELNPWWYPPPSIGGRPVRPGPHNPLGVAKIRTDAFGGRILMHGTNRPDQIGTNASHGCIRHHNEDIMKIFPLVQKGDAVYIVKNFDGTRIRPQDFGSRR